MSFIDLMLTAQTAMFCLPRPISRQTNHFVRFCLWFNYRPPSHRLAILLVHLHLLRRPARSRIPFHLPHVTTAPGQIRRHHYHRLGRHLHVPCRSTGLPQLRCGALPAWLRRRRRVASLRHAVVYMVPQARARYPHWVLDHHEWSGPGARLLPHVRHREE